MGICAPRMACAATRTATLRFARVSSIIVRSLCLALGLLFERMFGNPCHPVKGLVLYAGGGSTVGVIANPHILLLAGSCEARVVAQHLSDRGAEYDAWLSEAPRGAASMPQIPRLRRFDSATQMQAEIMRSGARVIVDAAHVFDRNTTLRAFATAQNTGLSYLRIERPAWQLPPSSACHHAPDVSSANAMIGAGARVFAATGWDSLQDFSTFAGEVMMLRQTRKHERAAPYPFVRLSFDDPPFTADQEKGMFREHGIDTLVCRNLGGAASWSKVEAALELDLRIILVDRPPLPAQLPVVSSAEEAIAWLGGL
ncbi:precorrin-6A/cobalt-precorrin-6A reductase [uncultured Sulfitobacter sp.]|uniref:precorrin-6A/cobalt-precorrin-6A reductase n=1 Tax=uncultured Sulfitobacter sp. TaxID=191468 RepID=UPI003459B82E